MNLSKNFFINLFGLKAWLRESLLSTGSFFAKTGKISTNDKHCSETISIIHQNVKSLGKGVYRINIRPTGTKHWKSTDELSQLGLKDFKLTASFGRESKKHVGSAIYIRCGVQKISTT